MTLLRRFWQGFQRLFGLNACTTMPPTRRETPQQRATRERLQRRLRSGAQDGPPPSQHPGA